MMNKTEIMKSKGCVCGNTIVSEVPVKALDGERNREWIEKFGVCESCRVERDEAIGFYLRSIDMLNKHPDSEFYRWLRDETYEELKRLKVVMEEINCDTEETVEEESLQDEGDFASI